MNFLRAEYPRLIHGVDGRAYVDVREFIGAMVIYARRAHANGQAAAAASFNEDQEEVNMEEAQEAAAAAANQEQEEANKEEEEEQK